MEDTIYKTIELENGYTLNILDVSRQIGADAWLVKMRAVIEIDIDDSLFTRGLPDGVTLGGICSELGEKTEYVYEVERNFIMDHEKDALFESLMQTFLDNLGQYVAKPVFPEKFVLKAYEEKTK